MTHPVLTNIVSLLHTQLTHLGWVSKYTARKKHIARIWNLNINGIKRNNNFIQFAESLEALTNYEIVFLRLTKLILIQRIHMYENRWKQSQHVSCQPQDIYYPAQLGIQVKTHSNLVVPYLSLVVYYRLE